MQRVAMFRKANNLARQYTYPIVISWKTFNGVCSSGIGTYVVINKDGWIVTAGHIIEQINLLISAEAQAVAYEAKRVSIQNDVALSEGEKRRHLKQLGSANPKSVNRMSCWWGVDSCQLVDIAYLPQGDLAIGRLSPFDPTKVTAYPTFKDPTKDYEPGVSLCKLGFPFHEITPQWDSDKNAFILPPGTVPLPIFPIEGILTRIIELDVAQSGVPLPPFPIRMLETSSPGLRGQSGGPTFDAEGVIWAIQSKTNHLPLGFSPPVPGGKKGQKEHQFLNVGWGVHMTTVLGFFNQYKIAYEMSKY